MEKTLLIPWGGVGNKSDGDCYLTTESPNVCGHTPYRGIRCYTQCGYDFTEVCLDCVLEAVAAQSLATT